MGEITRVVWLRLISLESALVACALRAGTDLGLVHGDIRSELYPAGHEGGVGD